MNWTVAYIALKEDEHEIFLGDDSRRSLAMGMGILSRVKSVFCFDYSSVPSAPCFELTVRWQSHEDSIVRSCRIWPNFTSTFSDVRSVEGISKVYVFIVADVCTFPREN